MVTDQGFYRLPALIYQLKPEVRIEFVPKGGTPSLPSDRNILVFQPSPLLLQTLKTEGVLEPVPGTEGTLYQLEKNSGSKGEVGENSEGIYP